MLKNIPFFFVLIFTMLMIFSACKEEEGGNGLGGQMFAELWQGPEPFTAEELDILNEKLNFPSDLPDFDIHTPSDNINIDPYLATIGRVLFYDKELSMDKTVSCGSCHQQSLAFADDKAFSEGVLGNQTLRNTIGLGSFPSFIGNYVDPNLFTGHAFFWDERTETGTEQIPETFLSVREMGVHIVTVTNKIELRPEYKILFKRISKEGTISEATVVLALSTFMNAIHSQNSFLDQALVDMGNTSTIEEPLDLFNDSQQLGRQLFNDNCMSCHGRSISIKEELPLTAANNGLEETYLDKGKGAITNDENDNGKFKIPLLRNIEVTSPYMHDGRFETLEEVVNFYSTGIQVHPNLNDELKNIDGNPKKFNFTNEEKQALVDFLKTMTDETLLTDHKFSDPFK